MDSLKSEKGYWMPCLMLMLAFTGFVVIWMGWVQFNIEQRFRTFVPAEATVTKSTTRTVYRRSSYRRGYYGPVTRLDFQYTASGGITRTASTEQSPYYYQKDPADAAIPYQSYWTAGKTFTVFVNPRDADEWSMIDRPMNSTLFELGLGIVLALTGSMMFYPMLFKMIAGEPVSDYIPADDPRALARDNHLRL